jgi:hypothetical protein
VTELLKGTFSLFCDAVIRLLDNCAGGNLGQLLANKAKPLSMSRRMRIARDIVKGMVWPSRLFFFPFFLFLCILCSYSLVSSLI